MCGIFGWFGNTPERGLHELQEMAQLLQHRGPDGQGSRLYERAALGHTRLAIIDPRGGEQPITAPDSACVMVYNGEIYNYRALRSALAAEGVRFRSHSDAEVIVAGYHRHGTAFFNRLRGMYAFAIWDASRQRGVLARDPLGIKPLFLTALPDGRTAFASEAKALRRLAPAPLDAASLHLVMNFRYLPGNGSLFQGIEQLAPGKIMEWHNGRIDCTGHIKPVACTTGDDDLIEVLSDSVLAHLESDVPVAAYLSGGLDSATVTSLAQRHGGLHATYTLDVGDDPGEAANARRTAALLHVPNHAADAPGADVERLRALVWHLEVPKINALQLDGLAERASRDVKVVLSGLGGDELFAGYNAHGIYSRAMHFGNRVPAAFAHAGAHIAAWRRTPWTEPERAFRMLAAHGDAARAYGLLRNVWDSPERRRWLYGPRLLDAQLPDAFETLTALWPDATPLEAMRRFEWEQKMVNDLLWQEDRVAMRFGLEARVPFVDSLVHDYASRYSMEELMPARRPKAWFRERIGALLPKEILSRPKSGFQVDAPRFFHAGLRTVADEWLSDERVRRMGVFNPDTVAALRRLPPRRAWRWHFMMLYLMLMTHLWLDVFEDNESPR